MIGGYGLSSAVGFSFSLLHRLSLAISRELDRDVVVLYSSNLGWRGRIILMVAREGLLHRGLLGKERSTMTLFMFGDKEGSGSLVLLMVE